MGSDKRDTYKYHLIHEGRLVYRGITNDLARREAIHSQTRPGSHIKQIGVITTQKKAQRWQDGLR